MPPEDIPPAIPDPVLGINFARDYMSREHWLAKVALHSDSWLLSVAFYNGACLNRTGRYDLAMMEMHIYGDGSKFSVAYCDLMIDRLIDAFLILIGLGTGVPMENSVINYNYKM